MSTSSEKRTQAERSEATRTALMDAARRLFAERGYADVGTEEIVREAGVTRRFLDRCLEPEVQRIALLDAPAVLGWEQWREIGARYGLGLISALLTAGIEAGELRRQPVDPLAHALLGALDEIAMLVARADDPPRARAEAGETLAGLIEALRV